MRRQLLFSSLVFLFIALGTTLAILYGRGYRIGQTDGQITVGKTGILHATSIPDGAQIFINDHLTTATESTLNLTPGEYTVKIVKDGYFPWVKKIKIKDEIVSEADATLFPIAPALESISTMGVQEPLLDPSGSKLAFRVSSESATKKNGIYILDMSSRPVLTLQSSSTQIANDTSDTFSQAYLSWSPDGQELLASTSASPSVTTSYLLQTNGFNDSPRDVTAILPTVLDDWQKAKAEKDQAQLASLKLAVRKLIHDDFSVVSWSPDETKILYTASQSATLPLVITPRRIGINTLTETRTIKEHGVYVYDLKEDVNTQIADRLPMNCQALLHDCEPSIKWFPDSEHLIIVDQQKITILEDDGTNATTVYAGPFIPNYVFPWPNGSKLVIVTNLNNLTIPPTLYTIGVK